MLDAVQQRSPKMRPNIWLTPSDNPMVDQLRAIQSVTDDYQRVAKVISSNRQYDY
jgi:hypothetical protein